MAPASSAPTSWKGRRIVESGRVAGTVSEWHGTWGWVVPLTKLSHPALSKTAGRIYAYKTDLRRGTQLDVGSQVDFLLYSDSRGLGAADCQVVVDEPEASPAAPARAQLQRVKQESGKVPAEATLPDGWCQVWSEEHDQWYYWNRATKESSWKKPDSEEEDEDQEAEEQDDSSLPPGWERHVDTEHSEVYYWHTPTRTSSWQRPGAVEAKDVDLKPQAVQASPSLPQKRVCGQVQKWQGSAGWITTEDELSEELALLLQEGRIYVNWRNVQKGVDLKEGLLVEFFLSADSNGLVATDVRLQGDSDKFEEMPAVEENDSAARPWRKRRRGGGWATAAGADPVGALTKQWAVEDEKLGLGWEVEGDEEEVEAEDDTPAEEESEELAQLLPGWEQHWSEERQCHFYWHKASKQSSWERPCVPSGADDVKAEAETEAEKALESLHSPALKVTPITPSLATESQAVTPSTPGAIRKAPELPRMPVLNPQVLQRVAASQPQFRRPLPKPSQVIFPLYRPAQFMPQFSGQRIAAPARLPVPLQPVKIQRRW